jgi:hypothetical protein
MSKKKPLTPALSPTGRGSNIAINPWSELGVSAYPPSSPMVGQEQVHRHLDSALKNFQPNDSSSAWFCALTSTWGGGKTRTADELVSQVTGETCGWIDRTGSDLPPILKPDFEDGLVPVMVSYKWVIQQIEEVGRRLPFTEWIPRVTLVSLLGLRDHATPQLKAVMESLDANKPTVAKAIRELPKLKDVTDEKSVVNGVVAVMKEHGLNRLLVIVEEVEDPSEIRNKPQGRVLGDEQYQEIKDVYLDVIPEVMKSDIERQRFPNVGFLLLCSPAVYSTIHKIQSQARRHYSVPIGRNTVADLCGYLTHLRKAQPSIPKYGEDLIRATYLATDRNMGWMNVVMYSIHKEFIKGNEDPVSLLRQFALGDSRAREVFVENGLARIPGSGTNATAQKLLFGQTPLPVEKITDDEKLKLIAMNVVDAASTKAFTELYPLRASLSELLETAQQEAGVQVISGGGALVRAGDMPVDLARLMEDLSAYQCDEAGRPVLPRDRDQFVLHVTTLHGISQTGAAAQYLYPVFLNHLAETPTHFGPSFAALRQIDKRLQREEIQFRLLDDEETERKFSEKLAALSDKDRLRRFAQGFLNTIDESQTLQEQTAEDHVVVAAVTLERTDPLLLSQDSKIWVVVGDRGTSVRDVLTSLCASTQPVRPVLLLLRTDDPSHRELIDQFLENRPATKERVFLFPLAEVDERLLFLKAENFNDSTLTNLARSLLYRLAERIKESLAKRFDELVKAGVVVRPLFRSNSWKTFTREFAEVWLFLAAKVTNDLTQARSVFGEQFVANFQDALGSNKPTAKKPTTELVDHDADPPSPEWPSALARVVALLKDTPRSVEGLTARFFGSGAKPREIVEQMLQWLQAIGLVVHNVQDDTYRLLTRGDVETAAQTAQSWYDNDLKQLLNDVSRYTGIQQKLTADGAEMKARLHKLTKSDRLTSYQSLGQELSASAENGITEAVQQAAFTALALHLDFQHRQMATNKPAKGDSLAQDATSLEDHIKAKDIPFRDRADGLGAFVKRMEKRVDQLHNQITAAKGQYKQSLESKDLPSLVFEVPAEGLLILTKRDQPLGHTTKGVMQNETLIHHLIQSNLRNAEKCVEEAERRLTALKSSCDEWIQQWERFSQEVKKLEREYHGYRQECDALVSQSSDPVFVKKHLEHLTRQLSPLLVEADDSVVGLQDMVGGDYAEQVKAKDQGGPPFDQSGSPVLLNEARKLIRDLHDGPVVSTARLREKLEPLAGQKALYAGELMAERGSAIDPGLGLLRYAMNRIDQNASLHAEQRLQAAVTLRALVEEAYKLREEWRTNGPQRLGDSDLFGFFLKVISDTELGTKAIPPSTDWEKLGQLKDQNLVTLKLRD